MALTGDVQTRLDGTDSRKGPCVKTPSVRWRRLVAQAQGVSGSRRTGISSYHPSLPCPAGISRCRAPMRQSSSGRKPDESAAHAGEAEVPDRKTRWRLWANQGPRDPYQNKESVWKRGWDIPGWTTPRPGGTLGLAMPLLPAFRRLKRGGSSNAALCRAKLTNRGAGNRRLLGGAAGKERTWSWGRTERGS